MDICPFHRDQLYTPASSCPKCRAQAQGLAPTPSPRLPAKEYLLSAISCIHAGRHEKAESLIGKALESLAVPLPPSDAAPAREVWMLERRGVLDPRWWGSSEKDAEDYIREHVLGTPREHIRIVRLVEAAPAAAGHPAPAAPCLACLHPDWLRQWVETWNHSRTNEQRPMSQDEIEAMRRAQEMFNAARLHDSTWVHLVAYAAEQGASADE